MKNRFIRVTIITSIIYIIYTFFFVEDIIDVEMDKNNFVKDNTSFENKIDSIVSYNDSISESEIKLKN